MGFKKNSPAYKFCIENHCCTKCGMWTSVNPFGGWYKSCDSCRAKSLYYANKRRARECKELDACPGCGKLLQPDEDICPACGLDFWAEKEAELKKKNKKW